MFAKLQTQSLLILNLLKSGGSRIILPCLQWALTSSYKFALLSSTLAKGKASYAGFVWCKIVTNH